MRWLFKGMDKMDYIVDNPKLEIQYLEEIFTVVDLTTSQIFPLNNRSLL